MTPERRLTYRRVISCLGNWVPERRPSKSAGTKPLEKVP